MLLIFLVFSTQLSSLPIFFFNDTATTEIYTLSLHDALPISTTCATGFQASRIANRLKIVRSRKPKARSIWMCVDRKSTRLNSSHGYISYAVFCLKKKKKYRVHSSKSVRRTHLLQHDNNHL